MGKLKVSEKLRRYLDPRSAVKFWHTPIFESKYEYSTLNDYYIDFTAKLSYRGPYDAMGVPLLNYLGDIGPQYNPCAVAQWGLGAFQAWMRNGDPKALNCFEIAALWLAENQENDGTWLYRFPLHMYGVAHPWISGLAQSQASSLLYRHAKFSGTEHSLRAADAGIEAMVRSIDDRGTLREWGQYCVIEEVVSDRPSVILDGFMFSIFGLLDHAYMHSASRHEQVLKDCVGSLVALLPEFDLGYWSRADIYSENPKMPASPFYHHLHVIQLSVLSKVFPQPELSRYCAQWKRYERSPVSSFKARIAKVVFKIGHY